MSEPREEQGSGTQPEATSSVDEAQRSYTEPVGDAAASAAAAVSDAAGETVRDAFAEGEKETTPAVLLGGVSLVLTLVLAVLIAAGLILYFAFGGD